MTLKRKEMEEKIVLTFTLVAKKPKSISASRFCA
jgi:hypothetical protein